MPEQGRESTGASRVYRVVLGHLEIEVTGRDAADALRRARHRLARELPRLWDVIHQLADDRFQLIPAS